MNYLKCLGFEILTEGNTDFQMPMEIFTEESESNTGQNTLL